MTRTLVQARCFHCFVCSLQYLQFHFILIHCCNLSFIVSDYSGPFRLRTLIIFFVLSCCTVATSSSSLASESEFSSVASCSACCKNGSKGLYVVYSTLLLDCTQHNRESCMKYERNPILPDFMSTMIQVIDEKKAE
jgi:hypothetical protein